MNANFWLRMQNIDRRILYGILVAIIIFGLIVPIPLPIAIGPQAKGFYDTIEKAPTDKIAIISTNWSASTQGENRPQTNVILHHLMRRKIKFALMAFDQQSTTLAHEMAEEVSKQYGYEYGKDWINWGYRADVNGTLKALMLDIPGTYRTDSKLRQPLTSFPIMQNVRTLKDVSVVAEASPSGTYKAWIQFVVGSSGISYCFAPTSVMAAECYPYLDSGQMKGMMFGIKGAAEYEQLLNLKGYTSRAITPVSLALVLLFALIGLGNVGMYMARKAEGGK